VVGGCWGRFMVPWISMIARPEGVCRSCGRGFVGGAGGGGRAVGWRGIDGMLCFFV